jgi:hypothetical protein
VYTVTLQLAGPPDVFALTTALNALAQANATWFLDLWDRGFDPPTSALEAGVRFRPRGRSPARAFPGASQVYREQRADCGPIAAILAGYHQARLRQNGYSAAQAADRIRVELEERVNGSPSWHAVVVTPTERIDPTADLEVA